QFPLRPKTVPNVSTEIRAQRELSAAQTQVEPEQRAAETPDPALAPQASRCKYSTLVEVREDVRDALPSRALSADMSVSVAGAEFLPPAAEEFSHLTVLSQNIFENRNPKSAEGCVWHCCDSVCRSRWIGGHIDWRNLK
ncbi:MAG: hypothetical protein WBW69_20850, partial [Candidatus Korobacteraceae bacterium]